MGPRNKSGDDNKRGQWPRIKSGTPIEDIEHDSN
jgi:hypothetical protein